MQSQAIARAIAGVLAVLLLAACSDDPWYTNTGRLSMQDGDPLADAFADTDGDGILDAVEGTVDSDGDGDPDYLDEDSDGDGVPDADEGAGDPDGDGTPSYLDDDSDGDGIPDVVEGADDSDGDGLADAIDDDSDGDGILDADEGDGDSDGDGTPDYLDEDSDGDGIDDAIEGGDDPDGDGTPSYLDDDSDGDGWTDEEEGDSDPDDDGLPASLDEDSDGDGIDDEDEAEGDLDGDGTPDLLDDDADGDGIPDAVDEDYGWIPGQGDDDDDDDDGWPGDDDDDDDSYTGLARVALSATPAQVVGIGAGTSVDFVVTISNVGSGEVTGVIAMAPSQYPIFQLDGAAGFYLTDGDSTTRTVHFEAAAAQDYSITFTAAYYPEPGATIPDEVSVVLGGSADTTGPGAEALCADLLDDDGDGLIDCADPDCSADPACSATDWCCAISGDASTSSLCWDTTATSCVCAADSFCCGGGWDAGCQSLYVGCGATCN